MKGAGRGGLGVTVPVRGGGVGSGMMGVGVVGGGVWGGGGGRGGVRGGVGGKIFQKKKKNVLGGGGT